jgi:hypothetical protein
VLAVQLVWLVFRLRGILVISYASIFGTVLKLSTMDAKIIHCAFSFRDNFELRFFF